MASCAMKGRSLPEWFRMLPSNAWVNTRDTAKLFGMKESSLRTEACAGSFPKPSTHYKGLTNSNACMWKPAVLRAEWIRRGGLLLPPFDLLPSTDSAAPHPMRNSNVSKALMFLL
jgi:hypothetical protein